MQKSQKSYNVQVLDGHYSENTYLSISRWSTYAETIQEVLKIRPKTILEIGPGPGMVTAALKKIGFSIKTLDIDGSLQPDYQLSVTDEKLGFLPEKFDLVVASEVFEHIAYDDFLIALKRIRNVTNRIILTLPDTNKRSLFFSIRLRLPLFNKLIFSLKLRYGRVSHEFDGQHYWEIGTKSNPDKKVIKDINQCGWDIMDNYINIDNPYHRIIILKKKEL